MKKPIYIILPPNQLDWVEKVSSNFGLAKSEVFQFLVAYAIRNESTILDEIMKFFFGDRIYERGKEEKYEDE